MSGRGLGVMMWVVLACSAYGQAPQGSRAVPGTLSQLAWLAGTWSTASRPGSPIFEERWTAPAGGAMLAVARTLKGDRMTGFEFLRIVEREGSLVYIAQPGGRPPTEFALTWLTGDGATFENPAHDFPKVIRYTAPSLQPPVSAPRKPRIPASEDCRPGSAPSPSPWRRSWG